MNDDERFETFLQREASELNAPPAEVPREEMWAAIAAARAQGRAQNDAHGRGDVRDGVRAVSRPRRYAAWIGMAAMLLLGVGIGRYALQRERLDASGSDSLIASTGASEPTAITPVAASPAPPSEEPTRDRVVPLRSATAASPQRERNGGSPGTSGSATYQLASQQHLTRAEALVAVVAAMPADAAMDSLTGRWARDVLTNTRLLLDSPAGEDPVRRRLLEDLETVLVQLVQRSGRTTEDRAMIDRTLQRTQLLTRLRSGATGT